METSGVRFVNHLSSDRVQSPAASGGAESQNELSEAEQSMIQDKFRSRGTDLTYYKASGAVNTDNPGAKGSNIDFTI